MQSIRPPGFMTGRGLQPPRTSCAFAYANTLASYPTFYPFFPYLLRPLASSTL